MTDTWLHVNDATKGIIEDIFKQEAISYAEIVVDGDCGSVWGEHHTDEVPCPYPHVLIKNPTQKIMWALRQARVGYVHTKEDWSKEITSWHWVEDPKCMERELYVVDYRRPYHKGKGVK